MRRCVTVTLLSFLANFGFAQKTFNLYKYDNSIFDNDPQHDEWLRFNKAPAHMGKYVVYNTDQFTSLKIWRYFFVDANNRVISQKAFCCEFGPIKEDNYTIVSNNMCSDSDVYIMNAIITFGYHFSDIDTTKIIIYSKGNRTAAPVKTNIVYARKIYDTKSMFQTIALEYYDLPCSDDYEIILKNYDTFRISNITTKLYKPETNITGNFCSMYSYSINGVTVVSNFITLVRPGYQKEYSKRTF